MEKQSVSVDQLLAASKHLPKIKISKGLPWSPGAAAAFGAKDRLRYAKKVTDGLKEILPEITSDEVTKSIPKFLDKKTIVLPKHWVRKISKEKLLSSEHKAVGSVALAHEGAELKYFKNPSLSFINWASHMSPAVLLREHNVLTTLQGPGSEKARQVFKILRSQTDGIRVPEADYLKQLVSNSFEYGTSKRLSRHAIRAIDNNFRKKMREI
jgi:hypothetical protein